MGACLSLDQDDKEARARSDAIDRDIQHQAKYDRNVIKLLLLGAGESGKSTLVKQMKIIHNHGFTDMELHAFKAAVLDNLLSSMKFVLSGMGLLRINLDNSKNRTHAQTVLSCRRCYDDSLTMLPYVAMALRYLWADMGVRRAVCRGYEYELNDSAIYYFENMDRILSDSYRPSQTDVLRARVRTQGVIETCFRINNVMFRMFDVGGQRSERRKWITCFDDVCSVLFVAALSGYDMTLREDTCINRMEESLRLFKQIANSVFFSKSSMILFLNKFDLFQDKILHSERHLKYYFHDFKGPDYDVESAAVYIQQLFLSHNINQSRSVFSHFTTATDTSNISVVFRNVMETVVRSNLQALKAM